MFALGEIQSLTIKRKTEHGLILSDGRDEVLLPQAYVGEDMRRGGSVSVFLYKDSEDRLVATTEIPKLVMGEVGPLKLISLTKTGGFLDWGLKKDLFLPYKEMRDNPKEGDEILIRLYIDKSKRLGGSMRGLYPFFSTDSPYEAGDCVKARIFEFGRDIGTLAAVDDKYLGMIAKECDLRDHHIGDVLEARVTGVKNDGKLDLSTRENKENQIDNDGEMILKLLDEYAGVLPFTERADPAVIKRECGLSKAAFKRAVGHLYKERKIVIEDGKIRSNPNNSGAIQKGTGLSDAFFGA